MLTVVCVYKTGGDFTPEYVDKLYEIMWGYNFVCLTDSEEVPSYIPQKQLQNGWVGWWSKMEIFNNNLVSGDILFFDLDTMFKKNNIDEMYNKCNGHRDMIMLSDFYRPDIVASGVMYIPEEYKQVFYNEFNIRPLETIKESKGDGDYIASVIEKHKLAIQRWDKILPDYIVSYKGNVIKSYPKHIKPLSADVDKSNVICFHGKPRPHEINWTIT